MFILWMTENYQEFWSLSDALDFGKRYFSTRSFSVECDGCVLAEYENGVLTEYGWNGNKL